MSALGMHLGRDRSSVEETLGHIVHARVIERIWELDHTVWKPEPGEIGNRLGWLRIPEVMLGRIKGLSDFAGKIRAAGYTHVLLLGMGGSSLAADVLRRTFGTAPGFLNLSVLDSTDPAVVSEYAERLDPATTLFIVSTKSGTTAETLSFFKYFFTRLVHALGHEKTGEHFIAITDPGTSLETMAADLSFRRVFSGEPAIGGRYSALSVFGLVPAALVGLDTAAMVGRALSMAVSCRVSGEGRIRRNPGAQLGAALGTLARQGKDKLTFLLSPQIESFGDWVEQLIAESTGKEGKGILPVVGEAPGDVSMYGHDRVFVSMVLQGDTTHDAAAARLKDAGHPVIRITLDGLADLGAQFFLWEFATCVAGHVLNINPFDQPDVESAKMHSRKAMDEFRRQGRLPRQEPVLSEQGISVFGDTKAQTLHEALTGFLSGAPAGSYVALQAFVKPDSRSDEALGLLRLMIRRRYGLATTVGYGPRFLHSTGQLHKGDAGNGLFLQITCDDGEDLAIPDEAGSDVSSMSFGVLKQAQAQGDRDALLAAGRHILRLHISNRDLASAIGMLAQALA
ncbi:MAG TPA: glucose-6-phosphate isomerase [Deltaproteobacteria bacterium]|nr:glucose-6-phosphate isomerase [Deltaproteobacteria bacterium]